MKEKKISLIVPVYNGEGFIRKNLEDMKSSVSRLFRNYEIIVVVDGKTDRSIIEASKVKGIRVFWYNKNRGKGYALKYGFSKSTGDYVSFVDADHDIHSRQLRNFMPYLSSADMVIGSKRHPFSKLNYPLSRRFLSYMYHLFSWIVTGVRMKDTQSGLKLIKREVLEVIMPLVVVKRYAFDLELCFLAQKHGFRVVEAPISIKYKIRKGFASPAALKSIAGMFIDTLAIRYRYSVLEDYQRRFRRSMLKKED